VTNEDPQREKPLWPASPAPNVVSGSESGQPLPSSAPADELVSALRDQTQALSLLAESISHLAAAVIAMVQDDEDNESEPVPKYLDGRNM